MYCSEPQQNLSGFWNEIPLIGKYLPGASPMEGLTVTANNGSILGTVNASGNVVNANSIIVAKVDDYGNAVLSDGTAVGAIGWEGMQKAAKKKKVTPVPTVQQQSAIHITSNGVTQVIPTSSPNYAPAPATRNITSFLSNTNYLLGAGIVALTGSLALLIWRRGKHV